jgi:hypothetical protein
MSLLVEVSASRAGSPIVTPAECLLSMDASGHVGQWRDCSNVLPARIVEAHGMPDARKTSRPLEEFDGRGDALM